MYVVTRRKMTGGGGGDIFIQNFDVIVAVQ